jgi:hypothetical protein
MIRKNGRGENPIKLKKICLYNELIKVTSKYYQYILNLISTFTVTSIYVAIF